MEQNNRFWMYFSLQVSMCSSCSCDNLLPQTIASNEEQYNTQASEQLKHPYTKYVPLSL